MHDSKDSTIALAVKVMPKQYYQKKSTATNATNKDSWDKKLKQDFIAVEEPLQISLSYYDLPKQAYQTKILSITMRTPGEDEALIYGFLLCEGVINEKDDITDCEFDIEQHQGNAVCVVLAKHVQPNWQAIERQFTNHSSCGICGKTSLNALELKAPVSNVNSTVDHIDGNQAAIIDDYSDDNSGNNSDDNSADTMAKVSGQLICQLPELLREQQAIFSKTGGLHAAGLYSGDSFLSVAEDIGRHNAVDKVIGKNCLAKSKSDKSILVLSGRISFELVQKAIMANISIIVAVGAPSALAIKAAQKFNVTLIGFTKTDGFNVYYGDWRVVNA